MATKPVAGGRNWKRACVDLIRKNRAQLDAMRALMEVAATPETIRLIGELMDGNLDIIDLLYEMRDFDEPNGNGDDADE